MVTLRELQPGQSGVIVSVSNASGAVQRRLAEMGLTPGAAVTVRRIAPLGDPMQITLRGYELSLRRADAAQIQIDDAPRQIGRASVMPPHSIRRQAEHQTAELPRDARHLRLALAGNPNSGKTTLFNALTGSNQYVGNWPGVTVEKKEGIVRLDNRALTIVDLPGIYSLSPYSEEETVARSFIMDERPDAIINIVDATNLERNLYLTCQLLEMERPMVIALNFMDEVKKHGTVIDADLLSQALSVPVIPISARTGEHLDELLEAAYRQAFRTPAPLPDALRRIEAQDAADSRYRYITSIVSPAVREGACKAELTNRIDRIVTGRYTAIPLFFGILLVMFALVFGSVGAFLSDGVDRLLSGFLSNWLISALTAIGAADWLIRLLVDGIVAGVGGVLTFLPQIALLFFFLSFLEDSGYMARAAFITDRLLRRFGLSGKAFIPMLMGFGCSVPAIMGARTMESEKDRRMAILLIPFMSCSAKLPVYGLISTAFFGASAGFVVFALYALGLLTAVVSGLLFRRSIFRGDPAPFVLELPPYRLPSPKSMLLHVWERIYGFLERAGTLILLMSVLLWLLQTFDFRFRMVSDSAESMLGVIGGVIAPIFRPLGFGTWQAAVSLLTGLVAKEAVVASMSLFYGFSTLDSANVIASRIGFTPLAALSFLVFILLYVPCVAAIGAIRKETNSLRWTLFSIVWQLLAAYLSALLVYQIGMLF